MALDSLTVLTGKVRATLRDSEAAYITDNNIKDWLNEAYLDLNARLRLKQATVSSNTDANGNIAFPSDFVEMISLWINSEPVSIEGDETFLAWKLDGQQIPPIQLVRVFNNQFETYPVVATTAYRLDYVARPTVLSGGSDTPSVLTEELTPRLVKYAISEAKRVEGELTEAGTYMGEYLEGLPGRPRNMYRKQPGPLIIVPDWGPFDV